MSIWSALHIIDIALWLIMAGSVGYVAFFALASLLPRRETRSTAAISEEKAHFLVIFPAYHEDKVIVNSIEEFLKQDYPRELYTVAVVSDHMLPATNKQLSDLPVVLLRPSFIKSSKAKALQYAVERCGNLAEFTHVVVLDADNVVGKSFLASLNQVCSRGYDAVQCHRTAKPTHSDVAALDGLSEEINNTIFRLAHNKIGLSSALIGSGMCFSYKWFEAHVGMLSTAVEDRELEAMLMLERVFVKYEPEIFVYDEKVSDSNNFQRQRLRWMSGQLHSLMVMLPRLPKAVFTANINYIDKTVQQALVPRSMLIAATTAMSLLTAIAVRTWALKWWVITLLLAFSIYVAIPRLMRKGVLEKSKAFPLLIAKMIRNIIHLDSKSEDFLHTEHGN